MEEGGRQVEVQGKSLVCAHCGGRLFLRRDAQLNTRLLTLLDLDWLNKTAAVFVCTACRRLEWFLDAPEASQCLSCGEVMGTEKAVWESTQCLSCGEVIPPEKDVCPKCGWTYQE